MQGLKQNSKKTDKTDTKLHLKAAVLVFGLITIVFGGYALFSNLENQSNHSEQLRIEIGSSVDNFKFNKIIHGTESELYAIKRKIVIVNFWASWCSPCIEEMPSIIKLINKYPNDIHLLAISGDNSEEDIRIFLKSFPELNSVNTTIVWDNDKLILKKFHIEKLPESLILINHFNTFDESTESSIQQSRRNEVVKRIIGSINWYTPDSIEYINSILRVN